MLELLPDGVLAKVARSDDALHRLLRPLNNGALPDQPLLDLSVAGLRTFIGKVPRPRRMTDAELASIKIPACLLIGKQSPLTDDRHAVDRARSLIDHVHTEIIAEAGHMLSIEKPAVFNKRLLAFIDRIDHNTLT